MSEINFKKIYNILTEIKNTSGKNDKMKILKIYENDNHDVKRVLKFLYDDLIVTGLGSKEDLLNKSNAIYKEYSIGTAIDYLLENNTGKNCDKDFIGSGINIIASTQEEKVFLAEFFTKTLKIGITKSTLNKVYGKDFIPEHKVMLGSKYDIDKAWKLYKETGKAWISLKMDGHRITLFKTDNGCKWVTRNGKLKDGLDEWFKDDIAKLPNGIYDGEVQCSDWLNMDNDEVRRQTSSIVSSKGDKQGLHFVIFDMLTSGNFFSRIFSMGQNIDMKGEVGSKIYYHGTAIEIIAKTKEEFHSIVMKHFKYFRDNGYEGAMVNFNAPYQYKRTKYLMKIKDVMSLDLRVVGHFEGEGRNKNKLGGFIVDFPHNDNIYQVKVGSGLSDSDRENFWKNPNSMIGRIIEIEATEISQNKHGDFSLSYPRFIAVRDDKNEVNID